MLERISLDKNLLERRPERKTSTRRHQNGRQAQDKLSALTARFRNALKKSVEGIIEAGRVLIEAKSELEHGQFIDWVVRELRFGTRKDGSREADLRKAEMLMFLARNEVISKSCHWHDFPPSPRTLWELTQIRPKQRLLELIANGTINSGMTREEAVALRHKISQERSPTPKLKREIAALLEVCILLGGGDGVLAHIRDLKDVSSVPPAKEIDRAARWVKRKLAENADNPNRCSHFSCITVGNGGSRNDWVRRSVITSLNRLQGLQKKVTLIERDPVVVGVWKFLKHATG